jgi:hypothetical protein
MKLRLQLQPLASVVLAVLAAASAITASLRAQDSEQPSIERWVSRLSHPRYLVRQQAEAELLKIGVAAREALELAANSHDYELRRRAKWLLATLDDLELRRRLRQFIDHGTVPDLPEFTPWQPFSDVVGADRPARELFAATQQYDRSLLADVTERPADALARYRHQGAILEEFADTRVDEGALAALLFIAGERSLPWDDDARRTMYELWPSVNDFQRLLTGKYGDHYKRLMARWIALPAPDDCTYQRLWICIRHNLPAGLDTALAVLKKGDNHDESLYPALVAVGLFGTKDHLSLLEKQFRNADLCDSMLGFEDDIEIQHRDVALASAIRLTGQSLDDYGFTSQLEPDMQIQKHGFAGRLDRMRAFRRWQTWTAEQKKNHDSR